MAYVVNKTNGNIVAVVEDGTVNSTSTSISLVGKSTLNYGEYIAENQVRMLENFALETPPISPLTGQLWYDTTVGFIKTYNGTTWVSPVTESYYTTDADASGSGTITVINDGGITVGSTNTASLMFENGSAVLKTNDSANAFTINPADGSVTVLADPTTDLGIVTKQYVDNKTDLTKDIDNRIEVDIDQFDITMSGTNVLSANQTGGSLNGVWSVINSPSVETDDFQIATTAFVQAQKVSPEFTGTPTAPTRTSSDNSTSIATTAFVQSQKASPVLTGTPTAPTAPINTNTTQIATTAFVQARSDADKISTALTGIPTAPTAPYGTSTTQIATTAFVQTAMSNLLNDLQDIYAPINTPAFTGTPTAPTPSTGDSSTRIATTQFVMVANELWDGSRKFVSESDPASSQGSDGDFWFKLL